MQLAPKVADFRAKLQPHFTGDYFDSVTRLKAEVGDARRRRTAASSGASTTSRPSTARSTASPSTSRPPSSRRCGRRCSRRSCCSRRSSRCRRGRSRPRDGKVALDALTDPSVHAATDVGAVKAQVATIQTKVDTVGATRRLAHATLATLDGRVTEASSSLADDLELGLDDRHQVNKVQQLYPAAVRDQFLSLKGAVLDVQKIKQHLDLP